MNRKLPGLILLLFLGTSAASIVGTLVTAGLVALAFRRAETSEVSARASLLARGISESMNIGLLVSSLLLPLGWWWAVRRWRREP